MNTNPPASSIMCPMAKLRGAILEWRMQIKGIAHCIGPGLLKEDVGNTVLQADMTPSTSRLSSLRTAKMSDS